jgi:hypothetical protein
MRLQLQRRYTCSPCPIVIAGLFDNVLPSRAELAAFN